MRDPEHPLHPMPVAATAPWLNSRRVWETAEAVGDGIRHTRMLLGTRPFAVRQSMAVPDRRAAWPQPPVRPRQEFAAVQLRQKRQLPELACRRDSLLRQLGAQLSPCPLTKPNFAEELGRVEMAQSWSRPSGEAWRHYYTVYTTLHHAHIPFGPSALPSALLYISSTYARIPQRLPTALPIPPSGPIV